MTSRHPTVVLERMADHVGYELRMIGGLMYEEVDDHGEPASHAVLESYLLHVRMLSSFLGVTSGRAWPDDVVADDYFEGPHPPFDPLTPDDRRDIDRRLGRLSTDRLAGPVPDSWREGQDRSYWGRRVLREFTRFVEALGAESPERAAWFEAALTEAKRSAIPRARH